MKVRYLLKPVLISFLLFFLSASLFYGQYDLRQKKGICTTDDPRRVLIPPRDRTKDPIIVLKGGTLVDGTGSKPISNAVLLIQGDRIIDVGPAEKVMIPKKVERIIDVSGLYVVPGLIDLHNHFTAQLRDDFGRYRDSDAAAAIRGVAKLGLLLDGGITAVRDPGTRGDVALKIREAVERRIFPGPRVFWSRQMIASRGGHGDEITSTATGRPKSLETSPEVRIATGPNDWRLAVREQFRMHADFIKLFAPYTREEVAAAIDETHMHGLRVTADAYGDYVTWAVEAGIDCIEHPLAIPDETIKLMAEKGTHFVPTIVAFYNVFATGYPSAGVSPGGFFFTMSRRFYMTHEMNLDTVRKARKAGVKIGVGTDIPFENERRYPKDYFKELGFFKEAGFTDEEILYCATRVGAEILDMVDKLGTLEKGKLADVLVVSGNPLDDIQNLQKIRLVIADGQVVRDMISQK